LVLCLVSSAKFVNPKVADAVYRQLLQSIQAGISADHRRALAALQGLSVQAVTLMLTQLLVKTSGDEQVLASVSRLLSELDARTAGSLLANLQDALTVGVLESADPINAAGLLQQLDQVRVQTFFVRAKEARASAILISMPNQVKPDLFAQLPVHK
jgi:hypothetical protein